MCKILFFFFFLTGFGSFSTKTSFYDKDLSIVKNERLLLSEVKTAWVSHSLVFI